MRTGRKTDEGFTLVEIVVVVAIIAVLMGAILASINPIQSTASKKAATNMRDALLQAKQYAMTRGNNGTYMEIDKGDTLTVTFYVNGSKAESETISSRRVTVQYNDGSMVSDKGLTKLYVTFDKGSGACRVFSPISNTETPAPSSGKRYIMITAGGITYQVTASGLTGRVDMVRK